MNEKGYEFHEFYIPARMMDGIEMYLKYGIEPGSFLTAIIQNNLSLAVQCADSENLRNIPAYVAYFYNEVPLGCWGSPTKMEDWIKSRRGNKNE